MLPSSRPRCRGSLQPFLATSSISWYQPLPQTGGGPCSAETWCPTMVPACSPPAWGIHLVSGGHLSDVLADLICWILGRGSDAHYLQPPSLFLVHIWCSCQWAPSWGSDLCRTSVQTELYLDLCCTLMLASKLVFRSCMEFYTNAPLLIFLFWPLHWRLFAFSPRAPCGPAHP